jgi:hypothetical protein
VIAAGSSRSGDAVVFGLVHGGEVEDGSPYELTITGRPGPRVLAALPGFEVLDCEMGHTRLRGWIRDQSALQGVLRSLGDLGVAIEGVQRLDDRT